MRLNADGIKVDDFVSYNTSDLFLNDQPKTNDITGNTAEDQKPVENEIAQEDNIQENASQDQQPVDLESLKNETENSAQDTQSTESNPLEASDITNENLNKENE